MLSTAARDLKQTAKELGEAIEPITAKYNDLAHKVETRAANLSQQSNHFAHTAGEIQKQNAQLVSEARNRGWWSMLAISVFALLVGVFGGITWEQHNVGSLVVDLQNQVGQLQQIIKDLPATLNAPLQKKQKKGQ